MQSKEYPTQYSFDRIFDWRTSQQQIFDYTAKSIIEDVLRGYNGTLFCYGQTGSGKTHTMMGELDGDPDRRGLIPRVVEAIFANIFGAPSHLEFAVRVSFMEIYMERIRDLLNPVSDNLPVHEERGRGVFVKGLLEVFVGSTEEVYSALRQGQRTRATSATSRGVVCVCGVRCAVCGVFAALRMPSSCLPVSSPCPDARHRHELGVLPLPLHLYPANLSKEYGGWEHQNGKAVSGRPGR
jgi:hypothetical protein